MKMQSIPDCQTILDILSPYWKRNDLFDSGLLKKGNNKNMHKYITGKKWIRDTTRLNICL